MCQMECRWRVEAHDFEGARKVRRLLRMLLQDLGTKASDFQGAEVVCGELLSNALRYSDSAVNVTLKHELNEFRLDVEDTGGCFDIEGMGQWPGTDAEGGRGLLLVRELAEEMSVAKGDGSCRVCATLPIQCSAFAAAGSTAQTSS